MTAIENEEHDWEAVVWFLVAHNLRLENSHTRRLKDLRSTIETMDAELAALTVSYITLYQRKRAMLEAARRDGKEQALADDTKWQVISRELDRAIENFKQRVHAMG
ncbi:MAG: hypothetical protein EPN97_16100 [Alphaproteobacteria bacterium]|nr:MAG: hypothetical protein EPN97_16100 [Alphaproteobacteria bacterium]